MMSDTGFTWEPLLQSDAPVGGALKAALFTTYDRPDEQLLVEHLLPALLKPSRGPDGEGAERQLFLLELDQRLKKLHNRIIIVSSMTREVADETDTALSTAYSWIWRSIYHLKVGSQRKAVQHAKLWLLHWGAVNEGEIEHLEIVISSCNLTMAAVRGQIQAGWRVCLPLHPRPASAKQAHRQSWGMLPGFLQELAASTGAEKSLDAFVALLDRADCPSGVTFVASVPGKHSPQVLKRTPWGAAGLGAITPAGKGAVHGSILSPFVGVWDTELLRCFCASFGGTPERLALVWIDKHHPWSISGRWRLPGTSLNTLVAAGARVLRLRHESGRPQEIDRFHQDHHPNDERWSHAKVYAFWRGSSSRLLVTSANFSLAAWGREAPDKSLTIENFELGVCLNQGPWPFRDLEAFNQTSDVSTVSAPASRGAAMITWAQASWDGRHVEVHCRCDAAASLQGWIHPDESAIPTKTWTVAADGRRRSARVPWRTTEPSYVRLACETETVRVDIFDQRSVEEREGSVPLEVDADLVEAMRDELLFEQYGGRAASDLAEDGAQVEGLTPEGEQNGAVGPQGRGGADDGIKDVDGASGSRDSYAVPAFALARRYLAIVDVWADRIERTDGKETAALERTWLRRDGELLIKAFRRRELCDEKAGRMQVRDEGQTRALGAKLAAEELAQRLRHVPEE